jgi:hypothetical protein
MADNPGLSASAPTLFTRFTRLILAYGDGLQLRPFTQAKGNQQIMQGILQLGVHTITSCQGRRQGA